MLQHSEEKKQRFSFRRAAAVVLAVSMVFSNVAAGFAQPVYGVEDSYITDATEEKATESEAEKEVPEAPEKATASEVLKQDTFTVVSDDGMAEVTLKEVTKGALSKVSYIEATHVDVDGDMEAVISEQLEEGKEIADAVAYDITLYR